MNLEKSLYNVEKITGGLGKESKESAEIVKIAGTYLGEKSPLKLAVDIIKSYLKGKRTFKDEEVLYLAHTIGSGNIENMYKEASGYLSKNPAYGKARKVAEEIKNSASYMKKMSKKLMDYIGKHNLGQLYKIEDEISAKKKEAGNEYNTIHSGIMPVIKKYTKN